MKKQLHLLAFVLFGSTLSLTAQTTHTIDWGMTTGTAATLTIEVGDIIEWTNIDAINHNVVSTDPDAPVGFGSGTMAFQDVYSFTFNDPVVFDYVCSFHSGAMGGTITVLENVNCAPATDVEFSNVTDTQADFSWVASPDETNGYSWVVMSFGDDPTTDTPVDSGVEPTGTTTASAEGMIPDTQYDFYIETQCGNDGNSGFTGPTTFMTSSLSLSQNALAGFTLYPNPTSEFLFLEGQNNLDDISVLNSLGQRVIFIENNETTALKLNLSNLKSGVYFIKVNSGNTTETYRFIKK